MSARKLKQINSILGTGKFTQDLIGLLQLHRYIAKEEEIVEKLIASPKPTERIITMLTTHKDLLAKLRIQRDKIIHYWKSTADLENMYVSDLGKE